jgi:hypothetical protein
MTDSDADAAITRTPPQTAGSPGPGPAVPTPLRPALDDFQRALLLEQRAFCEALAPAGPDLLSPLSALVGELYALMRSPIYPKGGYRALADGLVQALAAEDRRVQLHGVLASPTAMSEVRTILRCAEIVGRYGLRPRLTLWLARWENLVEVEREGAKARARAFAQQARAVGEAAQQAGFGDAVIPIDVEVDDATGEVRSPPDVRDWSRRVLGALSDPKGACPSLTRDVAWSTAFYARQASLSRLGERQALFDLVLRRALGARVSAEHAALGCEGGAAALVTLELHKRFLPCYAASLPVINLDGRGPARGAAAVAVA